MKIKQQANTYSIDASGQSIGRLASKVAQILQGKDDPAYQPHIVAQNKITISNIDKLKISDKKLRNSKLYRYSGYPGGLKTTSWQTMYERDKKQLFIEVIKKMLPKNKLRSDIIKNIIFT